MATTPSLPLSELLHSTEEDNTLSVSSEQVVPRTPVTMSEASPIMWTCAYYLFEFEHC